MINVVERKEANFFDYD